MLLCVYIYTLLLPDQALAHRINSNPAIVYCIVFQLLFVISRASFYCCRENDISARVSRLGIPRFVAIRLIRVTCRV